MDTSREAGAGLFGSLKRLLNTTVATVENRVELFLVELREERYRLFEALLLALALAVLGFMALLTVTVTLAVIFWDTARVPVLVALSVVYVLATIGIFWRLKVRFDKWPAFSATLDEIKKDRACLEEES